MFSRSNLFFSRRVPSIRFKYGDRKAINQELGLPGLGSSSSSSAATTGSTAGGAASSFVSSNTSTASWRDLPSRFHPRPLEEEEMDSIRFGGAVNPIGYKPPKAGKKGGKK